MRLNRTWLGLLGLTVFFGWSGLHRIAAGKVATGLLMLFTLGGLLVWWVIDIILVAMGLFTDDKGNRFTWIVPVHSK